MISWFVVFVFVFFFFKQKTAYEMRISDWSSDVCSSDLLVAQVGQHEFDQPVGLGTLAVRLVARLRRCPGKAAHDQSQHQRRRHHHAGAQRAPPLVAVDQLVEPDAQHRRRDLQPRSEEHTSELQSLMRISYAVYCLKKKKQTQTT